MLFPQKWKHLFYITHLKWNVHRMKGSVNHNRTIFCTAAGQTLALCQHWVCGNTHSLTNTVKLYRITLNTYYKVKCLFIVFLKFFTLFLVVFNFYIFQSLFLSLGAATVCNKYTDIGTVFYTVNVTLILRKSKEKCTHLKVFARQIYCNILVSSKQKVCIE